MIVTALSGLIAGMVHVLAGPDHLAAVAPLAAGSGAGRWRAGFTWGVGHTSGVLLVGAVALAVRGLLPVDAISSWSERLVGVALIGVGLWGGWRALATRVHAHAHTHDGSTHTHVHIHAGTPARGGAHDRGRHAHAHTHASFAFGILHGLAGSSHILGIVPALALPTQAASVTYLLGYGVGNVATMTAFASAVGLVAGRAIRGGVPVYRGLLYACSAAAIFVGSAWLIT